MDNGGGLQFSSFRSLDDFLYDSARFQIPSFSDLSKVNNRMLGNLIYYQTNYMLLSIVIFTLFGLYSPGEMLLGLLAVMIGFGALIYGSSSQPVVNSMRRDHPVVTLTLVIAAAYLIMYLFDSVLIFMLGILLPIFICLLHSLLRTRNLKNKIANAKELAGLKQTPMGMFLKTFGVEGDMQHLF